MLQLEKLIDREIGNLKKIFPDIRKKNFIVLQNKNYGVEVSYLTSGKYACGLFYVMIEFPYNYPVGSPKAWITKPTIPKKTPHVFSYDEYGHAHICYLRPKKDWHYSFSSYEAATMIETWLSAFCRWSKTGVWDYPEAGFFDHLF